MSGAAVDPRYAGAGPPQARLRLSWSDPRLRAIVWQVLIIGILVAIVWYLVGNTNRNLAARHIATGFAFLFRTRRFPIGESLLPYNPAVNTYGRALLVGVLNTLKLAVVGVVLATILGTLIGIAAALAELAARAPRRRSMSSSLRDIPRAAATVLLVRAAAGTCPAPRQAFHPLAGVFLSNRGIKLPFDRLAGGRSGGSCSRSPSASPRAPPSRTRRAAARRKPARARRPGRSCCCSSSACPSLVWAALAPAVHISTFPCCAASTSRAASRSRPEYGALLIGLVIYTAAYIAEIVRAGILAVPQGQWEAAGALGLRRGRVLRLIVLPQALRVIVPPMTSQYLNLTKNSSLAVAIGYPEIVSVADTTLNQTGQAIEGIAIIMAVYLTISLSISLFMNWYNAHVALVER